MEFGNPTEHTDFWVELSGQYRTIFAKLPFRAYSTKKRL